MAADPAFPLTRAAAVARVVTLLANPPTRAIARSCFVVPIATGLPASPGMATGEFATDPAAAHEAAEAGRAVILVRAETSPDDVHGMEGSAGILTSRGGLASHAAVVARGWGIPAVVGAAGLVVGEDRVLIGGRELAAGAVLTIDGSTGEVFAGAIPSTTEIVPEAQTLLEWAHELNIPIGEAAGPDAASVPDAPTRHATPDDCLRTLAIKGFAQLQGVADAVSSTPDAVRPIVDQLLIDGLAATVGGAYRPTAAGTARAAELLAADRAAWGESSAVGALDAFLELDHRMKDTVTAWQLRDVEAQVLNDHSDPEYDRAVLDRLGALHADAIAWLSEVAGGLPRLGMYGARLTRALEAATAGDARFVASPRVDSYHGIWFELHEDLIQLAGRTRAEEVEAGRA
jgi:pyruvate,orthophosphate dikinase